MAKKKKKTKNLPAKRETGALITREGPVKGAASNVAQEDILIPVVLLMQSGSAFVKEDDEKYRAGDLVHSTSQEVICPRENALEVVLLDTFKTMQFFEQDGSDTAWVKTEAWRPEFLDQEKYDRDLHKPVINYYVLLRDELLTPNSFPHVIKFKGGSGRAGKTLSSAVKDLERRGAASFAQSFVLGSEDATFEDFKFKGWTSETGTPLTAEEYVVAENWFDTIQSQASRIVVDEGEEKEVESEVADKPAQRKPPKGKGKGNSKSKGLRF